MIADLIDDISVSPHRPGSNAGPVGVSEAATPGRHDRFEKNGGIRARYAENAQCGRDRIVEFPNSECSLAFEANGLTG
jgi:hypothetical protein